MNSAQKGSRLGISRGFCFDPEQFLLLGTILPDHALNYMGRVLTPFMPELQQLVLQNWLI